MAKAAPSNKIMRRRMKVVLVCFMLLGFCVIVSKLFLIQIVRGEMYQQKAVEQQTRATDLGAKRGTIYDRNGNTLAQSATVWNVCISPVDINKQAPLSKAGNLDKVATDLAALLEIDKQKILDEAARTGSYYRILKHRVDRTVYDAVTEYITKNNLGGNSVFFEENTKRFYTYGTLASTVLGFTNFDDNGAYGLEAYYDKVLSGTPGVVISTKDARGSDMNLKYQQKYDAQDGNSVVLTIDEAIQHFLERNLETAVVEHSIHERASGIVMNIRTGEILAMSTKPDFNPNDPYTIIDPRSLAKLEGLVEGSEEYKKKLQQLQYDQWRNKAISDPYEPGSVFKIITAATALDNNKVSINDHFFCTGSFKVSDRNIGCWKKAGHGDQNFIQGMQNSCNPVFIQVGQRVGARMFYDYILNFGLGELTGIDLPGEATSILPAFETLNKPGMVELASTSFGQTFKVTPLQLITATSAAVNGGKLMQPFIVKQILDAQGNVIQTTQPVVKRQVISEETSKTMQMLVEMVVQEGSGRKAAIPGYRIGGKTGTSQKLDINPNLSVLSFVGFAPMEDPQIAVLVMLDEPELDNVFGSVIAAPVVGAVLNETLAYMNIDPQFTQEQLNETQATVPDMIGLKPHDAQSELTNIGLKYRMVGNGAEVIRQIPQASQKMPKGGTVILYTQEEVLSTEIAIPNVVGMDAQAVNKLLVEMGLNVEFRGVITDGVPTVVEQQWPLPETSAVTGDIVYLTMKEKPVEDIPAVDLTLDMEITPPAIPGG